MLDALMELLAIVIAVWALLAQPLKDPKEGFSLSNVARAGYFFVGLIFLAGGIKLFNSYLDSTAQARADAEQQARIDHLRSTNNHLIKVMSLWRWLQRPHCWRSHLRSSGFRKPR